MKGNHQGSPRPLGRNGRKRYQVHLEANSHASHLSEDTRGLARPQSVPPSLGSLASSEIASVPGCHLQGLHMQPPQPATHVPAALHQLSLPPSTATFKIKSPRRLPKPPGLASFPHLCSHLAFSFPAPPPLTVLNQGITCPMPPLNISSMRAGLHLSNLLFHYCQTLKHPLAHGNT